MWSAPAFVATMVDMNRLRELTAELGFMPATTDAAAIDRHRQHNKNADYWLARSHRFDHLRRRVELQDADDVKPPRARLLQEREAADVCSGKMGRVTA
jgi:hypothetical protein